jgi:radical SAM superfamily enzyme YgiQ (UPF0313 family)
VGAAVSDYTAIDELAEGLRGMGARLSVSSLRVDPLSEALLAALAESGAQTLTLAPEAGSERLRELIHKGVTEDDLLVAAERADQHGFRSLKLYFLMGLPGETERDVDAIAALCESAAARFSGRVTANVTPFVPKAHTPLQWAAMAPQKQVAARLRALEKRLRSGGIAVRSESPRWAEIQGLLARGDRRMSGVLAALPTAAPRRGASVREWQEAMRQQEIEPREILGRRAVDAPLPWAFIQAGTPTRHLLHQWERAQQSAFAQEPSRETRSTTS